MWVIWILGANLAVFYLENIYRSGRFSSFLAALPYILIPILIAQIGIFYGFKSAPNLITAGALFSFIAICLRVGNTYLLGEAVTMGMEFAVLFLLSATFAGTFIK